MGKPTKDTTELNVEDATTLTPESTIATAAEVELSDKITIKGRIATRRDRADQPGFNLIILNDEAQAMLDALSGPYAFRATNPQTGEYFVDVTLDARSKGLIRRAEATGATKLVVEGTLTVVDSVRGRPQGFLNLTKVEPATLLNGGRIVAGPAPQARRTATAAR